LVLSPIIALLLLELPLSSSPHRDPLALLSFPTRRSSDLLAFHAIKAFFPRGCNGAALNQILVGHGFRFDKTAFEVRVNDACSFRSEEHTSELQSRENLVCRLLLEKKNTARDTEADRARSR